MVKVEFLGPLQRPAMEFDISNLDELKEILNKDDSLKPWIDLLAVALNDEIIQDSNIQFKDGDKITLLPPVCGG